MRATISIAILLVCGLAPAQTKIQTLAAEIEADAKRENPRLGLDTLIRAAERLRGVDPATARHLLDVGAPWLDRFPPPSYFTYRYMITYANIDADAAEKAGSAIADKMWVHTALIERAGRVKDYGRVSRLVRQAAQDGVYSSGAITFVLQNMLRDTPQDAAALLGQRVADFPGARAKAADVRALLNALAVFPKPDAELTRAAVRKIFSAIDRPGFTDKTENFEDKATYIVSGKQFKTETTFETVLLPATAYLAVFDPEAYRSRISTLPEWGPALANLTAGDLPRLERTSSTRFPKALPGPPKPAPVPDVSKMTYDEGLAIARSLEFPANYFVLARLAVRQDFTTEQRKAAFERIIPLLRRAEPPMRYQSAQWLVSRVADSKIEGLFAEAALEWLGAFDAAIDSNDRILLSDQEKGLPNSELLQMDALFSKHDFAFSQPHPSIASRRVLARLDQAAGEIADFSLASVDGRRFHLGEVKGKIVLIDFWATWCPPCRDAVPALEKIHREWSGKGVVVLGVDDEPAGVIASFNSKNGITYPTLLDQDRKVHDLFGVDGNGQGIPLTVVFDREGKFVGRIPDPHTEENFLKALRSAGL
jgi:thiol-disulfide isomerase/thioredoxin